MDIIYQIEDNLSAKEFKELLIASTLGERRPVESMGRLEKMLKNANLVYTARENGLLVGVARSFTDYGFCTYMSDLAVHKNYQHQGIGKELIRLTKLETPEATLILLAAPAAIDYYPKIGMSRYEYAFKLTDIDHLKK